MTLREFESPDALAERIAAEITDRLHDAMQTGGQATLAVSGGSTPVRLFRALSQRMVPWERVSITLVDERWVPADHERSNERLVRENLMIDRAAAANFVALTSDHATPEQGAATVGERLAVLPRPFDVLMLGMGGDGHTASLFPDGDNLDAAASMETRDLVAPMNAPSQPEPRITMTLPTILDARHLYLHIEGREKLGVFERAKSDGEANELPIRYVLRNAGDLQVIWAP